MKGRSLCEWDTKGEEAEKAAAVRKGTEPRVEKVRHVVTGR